MAFVPALIHTVGAFYPVGGSGRIPAVLAARAVAAGVSILRRDPMDPALR